MKNVYLKIVMVALTINNSCYFFMDIYSLFDKYRISRWLFPPKACFLELNANETECKKI